VDKKVDRILQNMCSYFITSAFLLRVSRFRVFSLGSSSSSSSSSESSISEEGDLDFENVRVDDLPLLCDVGDDPLSR